MKKTLIQIITEEEKDLLDLEIYEKFPFLKEEKQNFNKFAQQFCDQFTDSTNEEEQTEYSSLGSQSDLSNNQSYSSNEIEYTKSPRSKAQSRMLTSSNINFDTTFDDKSPNVQSQQFEDSLNKYAVQFTEEDFARLSKKSYQTNISQDSPKIEKIKKAKRTRTDSQTYDDKIEKGLISSIVDALFNKIQDFIIQKQDSQFYGLDNNIIDLNEIKLKGDGRINYQNKFDLKTVTFLISGYLTQDIKTSLNFKDLANTKNKECQDNLFVFFKWSNSSFKQIINKFLESCQQGYKPSIYQSYLNELLDSCLQEHFNQNIIIIIYWLIELLGKYLKFFGPSLFSNFISKLKIGFDVMIKNFQETYEDAIKGGEVLAERINNQNLMGSLNLDFMGHSLGTVVVAYALEKLFTPARYIMLFGGAATITEIEESQGKFQKCYNFYSDHDKVVKIFLEYAKLIGKKDFIGTKSFGQRKDKFFNFNTKIGHVNYIFKFQKFYDLAMTEFNKPSNSIDLIEKPNMMKIGFGGLLLYLIQKNSQSNQVSVIYLFILYIYYLFQ
ncbi:hypothetical protein TTHERM_00782170 (macronuclear) [Tetrahymena thermophila SB210]|uniref:Transmembrane protein n=1 Tax=Tetrahymena thermophila (strain SB210) TaxID=312017 RepID=Q231S4_TETTS|nr:hypothetical protein TTHERM_00782170 [Tetrahymena thermophila SB210]EAR91228.2 hypothetical protein TTHERM_00782170 [Tetrahymena thermophila SB210]|eukprot:XP_001011473.2 hypothetical protein TTHERM_00782170 [Tetrahymena thermophila SB210]